MVHGPYKQVLDEVFAVFNLSENDKQETTLLLKKKLANELWKKFQGECSPEERDWVASHPDAGPEDPEVKAIQEKILMRHSKEKILTASNILFKKLLEDYIESMSEGLDEPAKMKLKEIAGKI